MSWKKYGGIKQLSNTNYLNVHSLVTDTLTLRENYDGNFGIGGGLTTQDYARIGGNLDVSGNLNVQGEVTFEGSIRPNNIYVDASLDVLGNSLLKEKVFFDDVQSDSLYVFGTSDHLGINTTTPSYVFDVCGNTSQTKIGRFMSQSNNADMVLLQNAQNYGITVHVDSNVNQLNFFHADSSMNADGAGAGAGAGAASIQYDPTGTMLHDVSQNIAFQTEKFWVKNASIRDTLESGIPEESTVIFYDNTITPDPFLSHVDLQESTTTGVTLKLVSSDASSNTFMKTVTTENKGGNYGGGAYMADMSRSLGSMGWTDLSSEHYVFDTKRYIPSQTMTSGTSLVKTRATTGFNTFQPTTEDYVLDVNGPMQIRHNEIHETVHAKYTIHSLVQSKDGNRMFAVGSPFETVDGNYSYHFLVSYDYGKQWTALTQENISIPLLFSSYVCDDSFGIVYGINQQIFYYTQNTFAKLSDSSVIALENTNPSKRFVFRYDDVANGTSKYRVFTFPFAYNSQKEEYYLDGEESSYHWDFELDENGAIVGTGTRKNDQDATQKYSHRFQVGENGLNATHIFNAIDGTNAYIINSTNSQEYTFYLAGRHNTRDGIIYKWSHSTGNAQTMLSHKIVESESFSNFTSGYQDIKAFDAGNGATYVIAVGNNVITTITDSIGALGNLGNSDLEHHHVSLADSSVSLNAIYILDSSCAIVAGDAGQIYYSSNYLLGDVATWNQITASSVGSMGNAQSIFDTQNNIVSVHMEGNSHFIFGCQLSSTSVSVGTKQYVESKVFHCYWPRIFYPESTPNIMDVSGNIQIDGNVQVEGSIQLQNGSLESSTIRTESLKMHTNDIHEFEPLTIGTIGSSNDDPDFYLKKEDGVQVDLVKKIVLGDANTRIDIMGYLNLLDLSATNIEGGVISTGGGDSGGGDSGTGSGVDAAAVNALIDTALETFHDSSMAVVYSPVTDTVARTKSKYLFVNYDGTYDTNRQTAGAGFYIYNDIDSEEGISVDQQLQDGYIRISKYKEDNTIPLQDSFSFRATGLSDSVRLNLRKINNSWTTTSTTRRPLLFTNHLVKTVGQVTDTEYGNLSNYEDDSAEIATDIAYPYLNEAGDLFTNEKNFYSHDISMTGSLFVMEDISCNGIVESDRLRLTGDGQEVVLEVSGNSYTAAKVAEVMEGAFLGGGLSASDAHFDGSVSIAHTLRLTGDGQEVVLEVSGNSYTAAKVAEVMEGAFNGGDLSASDADFNGSVLITDSLTLGSPSSSLTVYGNTYTAGELDLVFSGGGGGGGIASIISHGSDFYANNGYFRGDVFVSGKVYLGSTVPAPGANTVVYMDRLSLGNNTDEVVLDISGHEFYGTEVINALLGGSALAPIISNRSDLYAENGYFRGDVFVSGTIYLGSSVPTPGETTEVYMDKLKLGTNGSDVVLEISGNTFTASHISDVLNGAVIGSGGSGSGSGTSTAIISASSNFYAQNGYFNGDVFVNGKVYLGSTIPSPTTTTEVYMDKLKLGNNGSDVVLDVSGIDFTASDIVHALQAQSVSDYRVKDDVESIGIEEGTIDELNPVEYTLNTTGESQYGFMAHELQDIYPRLVKGEKDGDTMQQINYTGLIPVLVKEMQWLRQRVAELERRLGE